MTVSSIDYKNWFVLQVKTTKEHYIKELIESRAGEEIKMIVFSRELIFERKNREFKCLSPLFPSYIFVYKKVEKALMVIKNNCVSEFIKPLCFKDKTRRCKICFTELAPCQVLEREMESLLTTADSAGIISLSNGIEKGGTIQFINGPLRSLRPNILWINKKKKKACVEIELFKQKLKINLGLNLLS